MVKAVTKSRKRARAVGGKFKSDDPSTPDVNEAFVQVGGVSAETKPRKPRAKKAPARTRTVNEFGDIVKL